MSKPSREQVIQAIQRIAQDKEQDWLSREQFLAESGITAYQLKQHFFRWNEAVVAAGLRPLDKAGRPDKTRGVTKQELLALANEVVGRLGRRVLSQSEFTREAGISYKPIHRVFGSWAQFVSEAGLQRHPQYKPKIPDEELFVEFFKITDELGRFPTYQELALAKYSPGTFENRFGTYTDFKVRAMQYGIDHKLVDPVVAERETAKPTRKRDNNVAYDVLPDRPVLGDRLDFRGLLHAPVNELGVVYLFGMLSEELGFEVESVQAGFPDCTAKRRLATDRWQTVRIEFEYKSSNFVKHGHDLSLCDLIICWENDWTNCPIEVMCLQNIVDNKRT